MPRSFASAFLATAAMLAAAPYARAYVWNGSPDLGNHWHIPYLDPTGRCGPDGVEFDFVGDVTAQLGTPVTTDYIINPEYALSLSAIAGNPPANPVSVTYDSGANLTRLVETGGELPLTPPADYPGPVQYTNGLPTYHSGFNLGWNTKTTPLAPQSVAWTYDCGGVHSTGPLTMLNVTAHVAVTAKTNPKNVAYAGIFVQTKDGAFGTWDLVAYEKKRVVTFDVTNASPIAETIGLSGIVMNLPVSQSQECQTDPHCDENEALLDSLSSKDWPLPGTDGSPYKVIQPPTKPLKPGQTIHFKVKP